ncbi:MAG: type II toxin-antitoxin system RelB/DinJ family antitoxin [Coriobacteriales bacterium]|jgi:DNA-damage-inducible protein J|nr:type II toxin-antitoxin system RelB/DinJ family antitoxin [Coriobacteriales bacterium]
MSEKSVAMATKTISLRMDEKLYEQFVEFSEKIYVPVSALVSAFAAKTVSEQRVPFDLAIDPFYDAENQKRIRIAIEQLEAGKGKVHELIEA